MNKLVERSTPTFIEVLTTLGDTLEEALADISLILDDIRYKPTEVAKPGLPDLTDRLGTISEDLQRATTASAYIVPLYVPSLGGKPKVDTSMVDYAKAYKALVR